MKKFYFLSGLPRTGSTVLSSILNQHPNIHSSETSGLLELLLTTGRGILNARKTYDIDDVKESNIYRGMIDGYYKHIEKEIIFDKNRGWPSMVLPLKKIDIDAKIICTIRPIPEIVASYIVLIEKNPNFLNFIDENIINKKIQINTFNRAMTIWGDVLQAPYSTVKEALLKTRKNLLVIQYDDIINNPIEVMNDVHSFIGLERYYGYDFDNIVNNQPEKDEMGWKLKDLHVIRPKLNKISVAPEKILGEELVKYLSQFNLN